MLSVEKPPPDPPCPQQLTKHSTDDDDERASQLPAYPEVDLSKPTLPDDNLLPKFSIRDYVFTARNKDIKTNWPFSQKNLQLCLRHGMKDVLPPFQSVDSVRNQPHERCTVEDEHKSIILHAAPSGPDDHAVLDSSNNTKLKEKKLAEACTDATTSCRSEGENDFPSTITSVSQSEIEESVPTNRPSSLLPLETDTSLEAASVEVEAAGPPPVVAHKTESTPRPSGKKCRLVVKFSNHSERSSTEDIALNCTTISETMNSKICPVCKTFSSSSNTTLNAHIDQCLSGESAPKWTVDSKLTRHHRIKPRKTKLMVDIYVTAQHCTLEDLDRRNGSNWATITSFPTQDKEKSEMPAEEKRQRLSSVHPDDIDVGPVYVDANGTKVRILSKFDDAPSPSVSKVVDNLRPRKSLKRGKGSKFLSAKKQKRQASKYHKYLKLAPQSKKFMSPKAHSSQTGGGQERYGVEESCEDGHQMEKQVNPCNPGALRGWACSKRTGVAKKVNKKEEPVKCKWHASRNFLVESNRVIKLVNSSGNPMSSPENSGSTENVFCETQASDKSDSQRKRAGSPSPGAGISDSVERFLLRNSHQLSKDRNFARDSCMPKLTNSNGSCAPLLSNNTVVTSAGPTDNSCSPDASTKRSKSRDDASRSNAMKFPSSKKKARSVGGRLSVTESNAICLKNCSAVEKSQVHERAETDKEVLAWDSAADQRYDFMHNSAGKRSRRGDTNNEIFHSRSTMLQTQNRGSISISGRKETMALESSQLTPECYGHDEGEKMDISVRVGNEFLDKVDRLGLAQKEDQIPGDDIVTETSFPIGVGETVASLCNSAKGKSNCLQYKGSLSETEALTSPTDSIINEQETFYADEVEDGTLGQNVHSAEEMDSEVGQGSYFPVVDPIPIPGPPGSFLPSPRDMGSDDFQGNSSLTTSRVQSSQEQLDFIDGDSSDSPISTTSTISNFTGTKCDLKYSETLSSVGSQSVEDKITLGLSRATFDSSVEVNADAVQQITATAAERLTFDRENFKVNKISLERGPLSLKSNDQPCCCQRKERTSQGLALNYQDSQLLRRRALASATLPAMGKQMGCHQNARTNNLETRSDMTDMLFLSGCPTSRSEQVVFPVTKSPTGPLHLNDSPDGKRKFSGHGDGDSVSPSASNSILRLMGKNLMVVNRDEDPSVPPLGQAQQHAQINHLTPPFPTFSGVAPGNLQNEVYHSFHHNFPHGSVILGQDPHKKVGESFDATLSHSFRSYSNSKIQQVLAQGPASLFPKQHADGGFVASLGSHEYKGDYNFPIPLNEPVNKPTIGASVYHMQRVISTIDRQLKNADSASNCNKEIIIIDDVPENEAELSRDVASYSGGLRESQVVSSGILIPEAPSYNSKCMNPFSCYQSQDPSLLCGSPVLYNTNFHANISARRATASPVKWGCTSEGSGVLQSSPFLPASSSRGHQLRSTLYNSPSLS